MTEMSFEAMCEKLGLTPADVTTYGKPETESRDGTTFAAGPLPGTGNPGALSPEIFEAMQLAADEAEAAFVE